MYESHWQFRKRPFDDTNDEAFFYASTTHAEGLARLVYLVNQHRDGGCLLGPHGTGKTLLLRAAARACAANSIVVHISAGPGDPAMLVRRIGEPLGAPSDAPDMATGMQNIERACRALSQPNLILIVDDVQNLRNTAAFDILHFVVSTIENTGRRPTLLLAGTDPTATPFSHESAIGQRMQLTWRLAPFALDETAAYLRHRLTAAGCRSEIFDQAATYLLHENSGGIPRLINQLADLALLRGSIAGATRIDLPMMQQALIEHSGPRATASKPAAAPLEIPPARVQPDAADKSTARNEAVPASEKPEEIYVWE